MNPDLALTAGDLARMIREAVKDKTYESSPLGTMVARYIRWLRNEWGATPATVRDYESILARMCLTLADREPYEVSIEDLRGVIDLWAMQTNRTRQKVTSVIRSFWAWMEDQGHIAISPAAKIRRPRAERKVARVLPADGHSRLLYAAKEPRDRLALFCLLDLGVRKDELGWVALPLAVLHGLIDTRKPVVWWSQLVRQTQPQGATTELWTRSKGGSSVRPVPVVDIGLEVRFWTDQVFHIVCIAVAALVVG